MKSALILGLMMMYSNTYAVFVDICEQSDEYQDLAQMLVTTINSPSMSMKYKLTKNCDYTVTSEIEFESKLSNSELIKKLLDETTNKTIGDKDKFVSYEYKNGVQTTKAKKSGVTATIVNNCTTSSSGLNCKTDTSKSTAIGKELFEYNSLTTTCSETSPGFKKCKFETKGKAKGMLFKGSCSLAAGGAVETFDATYRMINYISTGGTKNSTNVKQKLTDFYNKASGDKNIGKAEININMSI